MNTTDTARQLHAVLHALATVLDGIRSEQTADPTPCAEFDVAALRAHVVGWLTAFTVGFEAADGTCSDPEQTPVEGTGGDQVRSLAARLERVLPEAASRPLVIGGAGLPGEMALAMILWEYQVHGWDLATATGQDWSPDEDGVIASLAFAPGMLTDDFQGEGKIFGPRVAVPDDAPALARLVALSGRDPG